MKHQALQGCSILIVEYEPLISMDIEFAFEQAGAQLTVVSALEEANGLVEKGGFAAAILDHALGDGESYNLYSRLQARGIPFIIFTGYEIPTEDRRGGLLIEKPATCDTLMAAVGELLTPPPRSVDVRNADFSRGTV